MNLLMAIIPDSKELPAIILNMSTAVKLGDLDTFQENANLAISIIERKNFVEIPENNWENILNDVRKIYPKFQSNFVLNVNQIDELLGLKTLPPALVEMLLFAKKEKKQIIQILQDDED